MNDHKHTNRLAEEKSPYLQQHAHNPVDWYPWSEAAFEKATKEDKPIFLSIGYSTCHWWQTVFVARRNFDISIFSSYYKINYLNA